MNPNGLLTTLPDEETVTVLLLLVCELCSTGERPVPACSAHKLVHNLSYLTLRGQQQLLLSHTATQEAVLQEILTPFIFFPLMSVSEKAGEQI